MNTSSKPGVDLVRSVARSTHAVDLFDKIGEVGIDSFLNGVVKDIPLIGTAVALYRAGNHILAHLFAKKLLKFLSETDRMSQGQRDAFYQKLSAGEAESLGETTLMLLERCDSELQAAMLGRAFVLLMEGKLDSASYEFYGFIVRDLNRYYVQQIRQIYGSEGSFVCDAPAMQYLAIHGLVDAFTSAGITNGPVMGRSMRRNAFGQAFHDHLIA